MDWNGDGLHDLLVGDGIGNVHTYLNTNTNNNPILDGGALVYADGSIIDVGIRATPIVNDWDEDGDIDLLVGNYDGIIKIYKNNGSGIFNFDSNVKVNHADYDIGTRAAPRIYDFNEDGLKDILVGEVFGYIYYLKNAGTNAAPVFESSEKLLLADGADLRYISTYSAAGPRSRLDVTDWNNDGYTDLLVGGADGRVMLFTAAPEPMSTTLFIVGSGVLGLSRLRKKIKDRSK